MNPLKRYTRWLHTGWPAGTVEKLPDVREDGTTAVPGLRVVGDLTGIPLLKFAADTGARAVQGILAEPDFAGARGRDDGTLDVAIVGGSVSGIAAAIEAKKAGLSFVVFEATEPFSTIVNFPKGKPIFTYPTDMKPAGDLALTAEVKEALVEELESQRIAAGIEPLHERVEGVERKGGVFLLKHGGQTTKALRVIVGIGRSGNFRKLGVPGEDLPKVYNRLHDPQEFAGKCALVVGGGDSSIEAAIALAIAGARVTMSYRRAEFSRPKPENVEKLEQLIADPLADVGVDEPSSERVTTSFTRMMCSERLAGSIQLALPSTVKEIRERDVVLELEDGREVALPNEVVFVMIGREPPLDFFRRAGVPIRGEWRGKTYAAAGTFMLFCLWMYHWKKDIGIPVNRFFRDHGWFPFSMGSLFDNLGTAIAEASSRSTNLLYTLKLSMLTPTFYYSSAYCACVVIFGIRRIKRRKTPYVRRQTICLMLIQCIPLFILPELVLPWMGRNEVFTDGAMATVADQLFERYEKPDVKSGVERAYWRCYGFILAFPLFVANVFTDKPMWGWLIISFIQTCVIIPLIIRRWGKGAYCGWICSCGGLAETMGDTHRHKMPHGPKWNRLNMVGQVVLAAAVLLLLTRILGWIWPGSPFGMIHEYALKKIPFANYTWLVDVMLAGVLGYGFYFWFSGRVWCRFACPLAALMHIYARFSRFRIFPEKKKCISCNVCTSVCHQGIDVMNFANKGLAMEDPECVRCSACVQSCPTGVLSFGRYGASGEIIHDRVPASLIRIEEVRIGE